MQKKPAKKYAAKPRTARELVPREHPAAQPVKAYKNHDFLMSAEARTLRMLAEYIEPLARLSRHGVSRAIIFWGSARIRPKPRSGPDYFQLATDLAERLARWTTDAHRPEDRYYFCCGGGPGIMEASSRGVAKVDRRLNVALNISLPFEQSVNDFVTPELAFEFHYFFTRKYWFLYLCKALVIFPGGYGTLDELFETLTLVQTGKIKKRLPILLFGASYWNRVLNLEAMAEFGVIGPDDVHLVHKTDDVEEAYAWLVSRLEDDGTQPAFPEGADP
jgi:uncharacterized protein (TIGR00730 family)